MGENFLMPDQDKTENQLSVLRLRKMVHFFSSSHILNVCNKVRNLTGILDLPFEAHFKCCTVHFFIIIKILPD